MSSLLTKPIVQHHLSRVSPIQPRDFPVTFITVSGWLLVDSSFVRLTWSERQNNDRPQVLEQGVLSLLVKQLRAYGGS